MLSSLRSKSSASVQTVSNKLKFKKRSADDDHNVSLMVREYENIHVVLQKVCSIPSISRLLRLVDFRTRTENSSLTRTPPFPGH